MLGVGCEHACMLADVRAYFLVMSKPAGGMIAVCIHIDVFIGLARTIYVRHI